MKIVEIHNRIYAVPEAWNELTGRQLVRVMKVLYGGYDVETALLMLLRIITGMSWYRFFRTPIIHKAEFLYLTEFLVDQNDLTKQVMPQYKGYYGPASDFSNITGEEFVFSEDFYFKCFKQSGNLAGRVIDETQLNNLVAVLYRPMKAGYPKKLNPDGDPRIPFNQYICEFVADSVIKFWPLYVKLAIFTWYEGCRKSLVERNPEIFSGGSSEPARFGLISVMRVIAEGGIHGDFEKVMKMYVNMWMVELHEKYDEAKRQGGQSS